MAEQESTPTQRMADIECRLKALAKEVIALAEIVGCGDVHSENQG